MFTYLEAYAAHFVGDFNRPHQRAWCAVYLAGLLQDGERKGIEPLSRRVTLLSVLAGVRDPDQSLQQFVSQSTWDEQAVMQRYRALSAETFADAAGVFVLEDTSFPKAGTSRSACSASIAEHSARRLTVRRQRRCTTSVGKGMCL